VKPQPLVSPVFACSVTHTIAFAVKTGDEFKDYDNASMTIEDKVGEHFVYTGVLITYTPVFADYPLVFADCMLVFAGFVLLFSKHSSKR
jgi:hypothetical protein